MDAFDGYWRKKPTVKRLIWKVIPDEATRLAALKRGEVDIAYSIRGELAEELQRTPGLQLKPVVINSPFWIYFADQWDPKSPWSNPKVRKAVTLALDCDGINQALTLGHSLITGSIVPKDYEGYWQPPKTPYDPAAARKLLAEAGFRNGLDGGDISATSPTPTWVKRRSTASRRLASASSYGRWNAPRSPRSIPRRSTAT
jgi:peptide/nickel transport system substrate-binding protein